MDWQQQRNHFNHDWMKNRFLIQLGALRNRLERYADKDSALRDSCRDAVIAWAEHQDLARELIQTYQEMESPKNLFQMLPLSSCNDDLKSWLPDLVHQHWLACYRINALVENALEIWMKAEENAATLKYALKAQDNRQALAVHVDRFRHAIAGLSNAISVFPNRRLI